jgi:RHS repeat-associated protein
MTFNTIPSHSTHANIVPRSLAVVFCIFVLAASAFAQSATDGTSPVGYTPGAPGGSYALSGFDNINFFNGNLNFSLPLLQLQGRGGAGHAIQLQRENKWTMFKGPYTFTAHSNGWQNIQAGYGAGALEGRLAGMLDDCNPGFEAETLLRLTFTAPDGTEYELRDQLTNGASGSTIYGENCVLLGTPNRGRIFVTSDGSAVTFISDVNITDANSEGYQPSGYLLLRDGSRFRIDVGKVTWMRDHNGNRASYEYTNNQVTRVVDSLGRSVTIRYRGQTGNSSEEVIYSGSGGASRTIRIWYAPLNQALRSGYALQTYRQLFPELNGTSTSTYYDNDVISSVELPDGRRYWLRYNSYGELARVELPTGGAFEYDWEGGLSGGTASGVMLNHGSHIYRRLVERRVYDSGGSGSSYTSRMTVSKPEDATTGNLGYVTVEQRDSAGLLLTKEQHYYYGSARDSFEQDALSYAKWKDGKEWKAEVFASNGTTVLRRVEHTWQQPIAGSTWPLTQAETSDLAKANNPQITQSVTTLVDTNQVAKQTFLYDKYCNKTDAYEYDYGSGAAGPLVRRSHTDYLTTNSITGIAYDTVNPTTTSPDPSATVHLRSLPTQSQVFDAGGAEKARTTYEYDNYVNDTLHAPLLNRSGISGLDAGFTTGYLTRGNVTRATNWILSTSTQLHSYPQYDIAGNVVKTIDARGYATTLDYSDRFGAPDGNARLNSAPLELSSVGQASYAFATSATNALGHTSYSQFDYYTGRPVDGEDASGIVSSGYSVNDLLDRPTKVIRAVNTAAQNQTVFAYDDAGRIITTSSDLNTSADGALVSKVLYDGLGRTTETRTYEGGTNYIAVQTQYDVLGRAYKTSNPFRPWQSESALWTTTGFDALGRGISVTTPDSAVVSTSYSGDQVTVTDQAGKKRKSVTDGLGRLKEVYEDPTGLNYLTDYNYDVLDSLTTVSQGSQTRTFVYDSLKRLTSAANPESGTISYQYDSNGNLTKKTDARGVYIDYAYDGLNRNTLRTYSDGTATVTFAYDASGVANSKGRLTSVSSSVSVTNYTAYDALGRLTAGNQVTDGQTYSMSYGYNLAGNQVSMTYPSGRVIATEVDAAGRTAGVRDQGSGSYYAGAAGTDTTNQIKYAAHGAVAVMKLGNGLWEHTTFNNRLQPTQIGLGTSSTDSSTLSLTNSYGTTTNNGNLQSVSYAGGGLSYTQTFGYDELNRLTTSQEGSSWSQTNSYDRYGNRSVAGNLSFSATNNRITTAGYSYDAAGNLTNDSGQSFAFDAENKIKTVSGETDVYRYDGDGNRVRKNFTYGEKVRMVYSGGQLIAEYDLSTGSLKKEYVYSAKGLIATIEPSIGTKYTSADHLGTPRVVTNSSAGVVSRHDYKPFGEELGAGIGGRTTGMGFSVVDGVRQKFTSKERDIETGLDYFGARYYSSVQGRFTSVDPENAGAALWHPQSWNGYAYSLNNPLRFIDPDGLRWAQIAVGNGLGYNWFDDNDKDANGQTEYARALANGYSAVTFDESKSFSYTSGLLAPGENLTTVTLSPDGLAASSISTHTVTWGEWTKFLAITGINDIGAIGGQMEGANVKTTGIPGKLLSDFVSSLVGVETNIYANLPSAPGPAAGVGSTLTKSEQRKLGNLASRAEDKVADVIRSRGGSGANVRQAGPWAEKTLAETAKAATGGDRAAATAIKIAKSAGRLGQKH